VGRAASPFAAVPAIVKSEAPEEAVMAVSGTAALLENGANVWPDDSAEGAFLGEARERGEHVVAVAAVEAVEETETKSLPPLDAMVKRLSPDVREMLDDLFRAKFVTVRRVPKKALKT
jgi:hypothetical protein